MGEKSQKDIPLNAEGSLRNRLLSKLVLYSVKVIPMVVSLIYVLNTVLSYCGIDWPGFSYIVQCLFIGFIYCASLRFHFCIYHRLFIHYITLTLTLNIVDYHWGIFLSDRNLFLCYMIITGIFLFLILYCHQHYRKTSQPPYNMQNKHNDESNENSNKNLLTSSL